MDHTNSPSDANSPTDSQPAQPQSAGGGTNSNAPAPTVLVRGEAVGNAGSQAGGKTAPPADTKQSAKKPLSEAKLKLQGRLPALPDDGDVGVSKNHVVGRDGKADLAFDGTLLASAAPSTVPHDQWQELRVYETSAGKYVFSKITRHLALDEEDEHEAEIFEPEPSSKPSQLLRNARDLTRAHPLTWKDEAVDFFGYEPLAKALYRKLGDDFEERVS
jgi:hypothetical protein